MKNFLESVKTPAEMRQLDKAKQGENERQNNIIEETGVVVAVEETATATATGVEVAEEAEEAGDQSRIEFGNLGFISLGGADDNNNVEGNEPVDVDIEILNASISPENREAVGAKIPAADVNDRNKDKKKRKKSTTAIETRKNSIGRS